MVRPMLCRRTTMTTRAQRGFTLVELAIVVAIVGILAVIALVGYRRYMLHSKITEARGVIGAIKIAQEDYRAERGIYADVGTGWCPNNPAAGGGSKKVGWDPACMGALPVHVSGGVLFKYRTKAGTGDYVDDFGVSGWVEGTANIRPPWYAVQAQCDMDGDGATPTELFASSQDNQIFSRNEGQ
jgi:type IV pilus assembly protein PilA